MKFLKNGFKDCGNLNSLAPQMYVENDIYERLIAAQEEKNVATLPVVSNKTNLNLNTIHTINYNDIFTADGNPVGKTITAVQKQLRYVDNINSMLVNTTISLINQYLLTTSVCYAVDEKGKGMLLTAKSMLDSIPTTVINNISAGDLYRYLEGKYECYRLYPSACGYRATACTVDLEKLYICPIILVHNFISKIITEATDKTLAISYRDRQGNEKEIVATIHHWLWSIPDTRHHYIDTYSGNEGTLRVCPRGSHKIASIPIQSIITYGIIGN